MCATARACDLPWAGHGGEKQLILHQGQPRWLTRAQAEKLTGCRAAPVRASKAPWLPYSLAVLRVEDYRLRRGVSLTLSRGENKPPFLLTLPPKRVFLPFPYHVPFATGGLNPATWQAAPLLVRVVPRITKKADVSVRNTAEYGLIARVDYHGAGFFEVKDALQRANRRDVSFGIERKLLGSNTLIQMENVFESYLDRRLSVITSRTLSEKYGLKIRADNLFSRAPLRLGGNVVSTSGSFSVEMGNVGIRRVEPDNHVLMSWAHRAARLTLRSEGVGLGGNGDLPHVARDKQHGAALNWSDPKGRVNFTVGNLNLEDVDEEGTVDKKLHQRLTLHFPFGRESFFSTQAWNFSGELRPGLGGVGPQRWGRNHASLNLSYRRKHVLRLRYDDDYLRFQGNLRKPFWQTYGVSLNSFRDLFSRDRLTRWGLDAVYVDFESTRRVKGATLNGEWRMGASRLFTVKEYDIPLEFGVKYSDGSWKPEIRFSIREYL